MKILPKYPIFSITERRRFAYAPSPTHYRLRTILGDTLPIYNLLISYSLVVKKLAVKDAEEDIIRFLFISPDSVLRKNVQFCFSQQIGAQSVLKL